MFWFVYIAKSRTGYYYTGISPNPKERLIKHNTGHGSQMAREAGPFILAYISKPFPNKSVARKREIQIKGWRKEKKDFLIKGVYV